MRAESEKPVVSDKSARVEEAGEREDVFQPHDDIPEPLTQPTAATGVAAPVTEQPEDPQDDEANSQQ